MMTEIRSSALNATSVRFLRMAAGVARKPGATDGSECARAV
jgi:hypothetical protein